MKEELVVTGIVLYTTLVKEYDKRLVVLTKERGKITMFANGARRPNSNLRAASQSFVMGKFTIIPGRDSYNLIKVEVDEYFKEIPMDMEKMCYASYMCEIMSYYTREGDFCINNLNLLYFALKALVKDEMPNSLIKLAYELRLMHIEGQGLHSFGCVKCQAKDNLTFFDAKAGGLLCGNCGKKYAISRKVSETLVYTLQYVLSVPVNKLFGFMLSDEILEELLAVTESFRDEYIDKKFKSLEILYSLA